MKNIVEWMGGQVDVQKTKGEGSTFAVDLSFTVARGRPKVAGNCLYRALGQLVGQTKPEASV